MKCVCGCDGVRMETLLLHYKLTRPHSQNLCVLQSSVNCPFPSCSKTRFPLCFSLVLPCWKLPCVASFPLSLCTNTLPYSLVICSHSILLSSIFMFCCVFQFTKNSKNRIYVFTSDIKTHYDDFQCLVSAPDWYMLSVAFNTQAYNTLVRGHIFHFDCCKFSLLCLLCCVCFQSGCLWLQWRWAVCYSCCWLGYVGVSVVLIPAAATSAAGAARTRAAARDTVSTTAHRNAELIFRIITHFLWKSKWKLFVACSLWSR